MKILKSNLLLSRAVVVALDAVALFSVLLGTTYLMYDAGVSSLVVPVVFFSGMIIICMMLSGVYKKSHKDQLLQVTGRTILAFLGLALLLQVGTFFGVFTGVSELISGVPIALAFFALGTLRPLTLTRDSAGPEARQAGVKHQQGA